MIEWKIEFTDFWLPENGYFWTLSKGDWGYSPIAWFSPFFSATIPNNAGLWRWLSLLFRVAFKLNSRLESDHFLPPTDHLPWPSQTGSFRHVICRLSDDDQPDTCQIIENLSELVAVLPIRFVRRWAVYPNANPDELNIWSLHNFYSLFFSNNSPPADADCLPINSQTLSKSSTLPNCRSGQEDDQATIHSMLSCRRRSPPIGPIGTIRKILKKFACADRTTPPTFWAESLSPSNKNPEKLQTFSTIHYQ
jgi:hypothetical protein